MQSVILNHLSFQKLEQLTERLFQQYDRELKDLALLMEKYKKGTGEKAAEVAGKFVNAATGFAMMAVPVVGTELAVLRGMRIMGAIQGSSAAAGAALGGLQEFMKADGVLDIEKLQMAVERQKKDCVLKMNQETRISDIELRYVLRKPFIKNPELEKKIETILISMRKTQIPFELYREYLINCLKLPFENKPIFPEFRVYCLDLDQRRLSDSGLSEDDYRLSSEQFAARRKLFSYSE